MLNGWHPHKFKRANKALRTLRTQLGRVIRDIRRKIGTDEALNAAFAWPLSLASRVRDQRPRQRGQKVYSLHAPEVECIGKGKAHKPYEFGVKVSVATPIQRSKGGQFVAHIKALPGAPYDGHTLEKVLPEIESQIGVNLNRIVADAGYKGHNAPDKHRLEVFTSGQKRGVTDIIKKALRRRAEVEPVIGHLKAEHRMGRNYLAHRRSDAINAVLAAVGYNLTLLIKWIRLLFAFVLPTLISSLRHKPTLHAA